DSKDYNSIDNLNLEELKRIHPEELRVAKLVFQQIKEELKVSMEPQEIYFFTLFLMMDETDEYNSRVGLIILAPGNGIARSLASVANSLLDTNHAVALDMPLEKNVDEFYEEFEGLAKNVDEGKGILIMTDMGSLNSFGDLLEQKTKIHTRSIDMISTPYILEALRKTLISEYNLNEIYIELKKEIIKHMVEGEQENRSKHLIKNGIIITTCMTGKGAAVVLSNFLKNSIPQISQYQIEVVPMNKNDDIPENYLDSDIIAITGS